MTSGMGVREVGLSNEPLFYSPIIQHVLPNSAHKHPICNGNVALVLL